MKKHSTRAGRNFGYGKQMHYAGKQALEDRYGHHNKFGTQASHNARFRQFSAWCKDQGIRDAKDIDKHLVSLYASNLSERVADKDMSVCYAQNLISSVNVVLSAMRGDKVVQVSPSAIVGQRSHIRTAAPLSYDRAKYHQALEKLYSDEAKMALTFAREFGLRLRETGLFRPKEAFAQYCKTGGIDIQRGVKGGRSVSRQISLTPRQAAILKRAQSVLGKDKCLVDRYGKYTEWKNAFNSEYRSTGAQHLIGKFHDNRAAFACEKMKLLTGKEARVINSQTPLTQSEEQRAKLQIAAMLGHGRLDVVASYTA